MSTSKSDSPPQLPNDPSVSNDHHSNVHTIFKQWDLYSRIINANWMRHREIIECLQTEFSGSIPSQRILDLGSGDGYLAYHGLMKSPVQSFTGVDLSEDALKKLLSRGKFGDTNHSVFPQTICGDILAVSTQLASASYDMILASYAIHHLDTAHKKILLAQIKRLLSPRGYFIWVDLARRSDETRLQYIHRISTWIISDWDCLTTEEKHDSATHVAESDFPESEETMLLFAREAGLLPIKQLLKDDYYVSWLFQRPES